MSDPIPLRRPGANAITLPNTLNALGLAFALMSDRQLKIWHRKWLRHCEVLDGIAAKADSTAKMEVRRG